MNSLILLISGRDGISAGRSNNYKAKPAIADTVNMPASCVCLGKLLMAVQEFSFELVAENVLDRSNSVY